MNDDLEMGTTVPIKHEMSQITPEVWTDEDEQELFECEALIARNLEAWQTTTQALLSVRDKRLYRKSHGSFDEYCSDRWSISGRRANQMIRGSQAVTSIEPYKGVSPSSERQAREVANVKTKKNRQKVWNTAVKTARAEGREEPTAKHVRQAVAEVVPNASSTPAQAEYESCRHCSGTGKVKRVAPTVETVKEVPKASPYTVPFPSRSPFDTLSAFKSKITAWMESQKLTKNERAEINRRYGM